MTEPKLTSQGMRVLTAFVDAANKELSGAQISDATGMLSGTLYPILIRFREAGWLSDRWEDDNPVELGRPKRRYYRLTGVGQSAHRRWVERSSGGVIAWA